MCLVSFSFAQSTFIPKKIKTFRGQMGITDATQFDEFTNTMSGFGTDTRSILTDQSVKPYMMPPRNVGQKGISAAYVASSSLEFYVNFSRNFKENLSPDYITLSSTILKQELNLEDVIKFVVEYGIPNAGIVPFDATEISPQVYGAKKYTIKNYLKIFSTATKGKQKVFEVRKALIKGNPVLIDLQIDERFETLSGVEFWEPIGSNGDRTQPLIVVSYDEDLEAFELQNNLGTSWGNQGYIWVKYSDFEQYAINGFVLIPE